jgi:hypothetical protein
MGHGKLGQLRRACKLDPCPGDRCGCAGREASGNTRRPARAFGDLSVASVGCGAMTRFGGISPGGLVRGVGMWSGIESVSGRYAQNPGSGSEKVAGILGATLRRSGPSSGATASPRETPPLPVAPPCATRGVPPARRPGMARFVPVGLEIPHAPALPPLPYRRSPVRAPSLTPFAGPRPPSRRRGVPLARGGRPATEV